MRCRRGAREHRMAGVADLSARGLQRPAGLAPVDVERVAAVERHATTRARIRVEDSTAPQRRLEARLGLTQAEQRRIGRQRRAE